MSKIITRELLEKLGVILSTQPIDEETAFLELLNATLDERVGANIMAVVGPDRIDEVKQWAQDGEQDKIAALVEESAKAGGEDLTLQDIIDSEVDILIGEIAENAGEVMAVSQNEPVADEKDADATVRELVNIAENESVSSTQQP
ncbi:hypothetical protein FWG95_02870 [Candidatus Saccharibacteria bacterium]|nr:hypothetical protein [Candidatus Saccharibacteria bacterium]